MSTKAILLQQFDCSHRKEGWFVPLIDSIKGMNAKQAAWKDKKGGHSVWQQVNHLIFWNERYLQRFKGRTPRKMTAKTETFNEPRVKSEKAWVATVKKADKLCEDWRKELKGTGKKKLKGVAFSGTDDSWESILSHITMHNAYHIGQIVSVRKLQGAWKK